MKSSTVSAKAYLLIDGARFELHTCNVTYTDNDLNVADCNIALGYLAANGSAEAVSLDYPRFTPASIEVESASVYSSGELSASGAKGPYTLFKGVLDDLGPSSIGVGSFHISVRLLGRLSLLHTGSMQSNSVMANQYGDLTFPVTSTLGTTALLETPADDAVSFGALLLDAMLKVTSDFALARRTQSAELLQQYFGIAFGNEKAAEILKEIRQNGAEELVVDGPEGFTQALAIVTDQLFRNDINGMSFYNSFQHLGGVLGFRLLELPSGIRLIPFTPFVASQDCMEIAPDSYLIANRSVASAQQCSGVALANGSPDAADGAPFVGMYARPSGDGQLAILPAPAHLASVGFLNFTEPSTPKPDTMPLVVSEEVRNTIGAAAAREACLAANYEQRYYVVVCPFVRMDLAPCSPVVIRYPEMYANIGSFASSIYGSVKTVNINIDVAGQVTTTITVGYARASSQQESEIDTAERTHPVWTTTFTGSGIE